MITRWMFCCSQRLCSSSMLWIPLESMKLNWLRSTTTHSGQRSRVALIAFRALSLCARSHAPQTTSSVVVPLCRMAILSEPGASTEGRSRSSAARGSFLHGGCVPRDH